MIGLIGIAAAQDPQSAPQIAQAKPVLQLRGDRFPGLTYDQMTPAQKSLTDRALANRGTIGTFNILLRSPELSEAVRRLAREISRQARRGPRPPAPRVRSSKPPVAR